MFLACLMLYWWRMENNLKETTIMNILKSTLTAALLVSSTYASAITFVSDLSDPSSSSSFTTAQTVNTWVDPTGTALDGATWIQPSDAYDVDQSAYSFYELDFGSDDYVLTSLFMSFDDHVIVSIGSDVIFDSALSGLYKSWTSVHDVFDNSLTTLITEANKLTFAVTNSGDGPTGVIWKGTAVASVPEPSMLFVLGLGLVAFAYKRKKSA